MSTLTEDDVYEYFGSTYGSRGNTYQRKGSVLSIKFDLERRLLQGEVQGSNRHPYRVQVWLKPSMTKISDDRCSCPMAGQCKHGAALSLDAIRRGTLNQYYSSSTPATSQESSAGAKPSSALMTAKKRFEEYLAAQEPSPSSQSTQWISSLKSALGNGKEPSKKPKKQSNDYYVYLLDVLPLQNQNLLVLNVGRAKKNNGDWGKVQKADFGSLTSGSEFANELDAEIGRLFLPFAQTSQRQPNTFPDVPELCQLIVQKLLKTERFFWKELGHESLRLGPPMEGWLKWETRIDTKQVLKLSCSMASDIAAIAGRAWYVSPNENLLGELLLPVSAKGLKMVLAAPVVDPTEAPAVAKELAKLGSFVPAPRTDFTIKRETLTPTPVLTLSIGEGSRNFYTTYRAYHYEKVGKAGVSFDYGEARFERPAGTEYRTVKDNNIIIYSKDASAEALYKRQLEQHGLSLIEEIWGREVFGFIDGSPIDWLKFSDDTVAKLKDAGWQIVLDKSFNLETVVPQEEWSLDATEGSDFWFSLDIGIMVDGKKVALLPIIYEALRYMHGDDPVKEFEKLNRDGIFYAPLANGRYAALPFARVKSIVEALVELFDKKSYGEMETSVSLPQLMQLAKSVDGSLKKGAGWSISSRFSKLAEKIKRFDGLEKVVAPATFRTELRPYQIEGLSWLNFLREFGLGGILADDMGLGKTVQALAHICLEKSEKRLDKPFLVVCPTSVLPNWISEINKFAPGLKVTSLYGPERSKNFPAIAGSDVVVTTYPLVSRDSETLVRQKWKAVVLDEAQMIKNSKTQTAQAVGELECDYRFCMTGTPVENHLGELWSQFNFLMPGFLNDLPTFTKLFRTSIEKHKDKQAQKLLTSRVRPFLLRRTKELVATELPEKTIIVKRIELEGAQRDLYETVRLAMYEKVKDALASKGLEKSQIIILDALLKLRQVCCDPRLVKMPSAKKIHSTAKLELLISMLEELLSEGKRILVFSQFTSMLDLVVPELQKRQMDFVEIRGDTKDRATPVARFQSGTVPIFLLSLKAGGFGLNLTKADTVIHYDPWWNPAVENQATDRAHRIGQTNSVFVFKLIAAGTIEERMLELQERKKSIAAAVYGDENSLPFKLSADDLVSLFKPLKT